MIGGYSSRFYDGPESPQQIGATFLEQLTADMLVSLTNAGADATFTNLAVLGAFIGSEAGGPFLPLSGGVITGDLTVDGITTLENASPSSVTATNSTTPRTLANRFADVANVLDYGADPTGVADSAPAFNMALGQVGPNGRRRSVYFPDGFYRINSQLIASSGQCLYGDSRGSSVLMVDDLFDPSASSVILLLAGSLDPGPELRDFGITFAQPADTVTTATIATTAGSNTITVASITNVLVGGYVFDTTTAGAIPAKTTILSIAGNVVTLSANVTGSGVQIGDSIHFNTSRALFQTLAGGGTSGPGGTGVMYPPAVAAGANSTRVQMSHVRIGGAWDGITSIGFNTVFWLDDIEMGALNVGLSLGETHPVQDACHINGWHFWQFDLLGSGLTAIYGDGQTISMRYGQVDGLDARGITNYIGRMVFTTEAANGWFELTNVMMDSSESTLEVAGAEWLHIVNFYATNGASALRPTIAISAGTVQITNSYIASAALFPILAVTGTNSYVTFVNGTMQWGGGTGISAVTVAGGTLRMNNVRVVQNATTMNTVPMIAQSSSGRLQVDNLDMLSQTGSGGTAINFAVDGTGNILGKVILGPNWTISFPNIRNSAVPFGSFGIYPQVFSAPLDATSMQSGAYSFGVFGATQHFNTSFGNLALSQLTDAGTNNAVFGSRGAHALTSGTQNALFGALTANSLTSGDNNTFYGFAGGFNVVSCSGTTLIGSNLGLNASLGDGNIYINASGIDLAPSGGESNVFRLGAHQVNPVLRATAINTGTPAMFLDWMPSSTSFANDAAAATGGVAVGQFYRNGSVIQLRIT